MEKSNNQPGLKGINEHIPVLVDWLLQHLIWMVNTSDKFSIGITLNVGGLIISGELVGGKNYFKGIGEDFSSGLRKILGNNRAVVDKMRKVFEDLGNKTYDDSEKKKRKDLEEPHFIHLRNARFYYPGQQPIPKNQGVWWRGKLEAVDAFCLGLLSFVESE